MAVLPPTELSTWASSVVGDLDEADAALVYRRREAGEIADHPAAERGDPVAAVEPQRQQPLQQVLQSGEALGLLARLQHHHVGRDAARLQRRREPPRHGCSATQRSVTTYRAPARQVRGQQLAGAVEQPRPDRHLVGARTKPDLHPPFQTPAHGAASASTWAFSAVSTAETLTGHAGVGHLHRHMGLRVMGVALFGQGAPAPPAGRGRPAAGGCCGGRPGAPAAPDRPSATPTAPAHAPARASPRP